MLNLSWGKGIELKTFLSVSKINNDQEPVCTRSKLRNRGFNCDEADAMHLLQSKRGLIMPGLVKRDTNLSAQTASATKPGNLAALLMVDGAAHRSWLIVRNVCVHQQKHGKANQVCFAR